MGRRSKGKIWRKVKESNPWPCLGASDGFRDRLPTDERHLPYSGGRYRDRTYEAMLRCLRLSKPLHYRSANLPLISAKIDLMNLRGRLGSNQRHTASKAVALPTELRPCSSVVDELSWAELYRMVDQVGFEPTRLVPTSGLQPGALPFGRLIRWYPASDSNREPPASKAGTTTNCASGAFGGPTEIRTQMISLLRRARLPITPSARNYPSRYRNRKMVRVAGFEPAASAFRGRPSTGLTLHPVTVGRGRMTFTD